MRTFIKLVLCVLVSLFICVSCVSSPSGTTSTSNQAKPVQKQEFLIFMNTTETPEHKDVASISIEKGKNNGMASYIVDRYTGTKQILLVMEFGKYSIVDGVITIVAGKYNFTGQISEDKIIINDVVYTLYQEKEKS
ncbi:MAG: hypothetical protein V1709_12025 [Planctomycetota bacterium]